MLNAEYARRTFELDGIDETGLGQDEQKVLRILAEHQSVRL